MNLMYKLIEKLKYLTLPCDGDEAGDWFEEPSKDTARGQEPIVCPGCETPLTDIAWPRCPNCGRELKKLFPTTPTFGRIKGELLNDMTYGAAMKQKAMAVGGGLVEFFLFALFCVADIYVAAYMISHVMGIEKMEIRYRNLIMAIACAPAAWLLYKIIKRKRLRTDEAVWEAVRDEYYCRILMDGDRDDAARSEESLIEKYEPVSEIYHALTVGEQISGGYKSIFIGVGGSLLLVEVWDPTDLGFEVIDIPLENIASFSVMKRRISDLFRRFDFDAAMEEILKASVMLEYKNKEGELSQIFLSKKAGRNALRRLIPEKEVRKARNII